MSAKKTIYRRFVHFFVTCGDFIAVFFAVESLYLQGK